MFLVKLGMVVMVISDEEATILCSDEWSGCYWIVCAGEAIGQHRTSCLPTS